MCNEWRWKWWDILLKYGDKFDSVWKREHSRDKKRKKEMTKSKVEKWNIFTLG